MASHRLSTVYKQSKQANPVGYGGKPKADRDRPAADIETQQDTAGGQQASLSAELSLSCDQTGNAVCYTCRRAKTAATEAVRPNCQVWSLYQHHTETEVGAMP